MIMLGALVFCVSAILVGRSLSGQVEPKTETPRQKARRLTSEHLDEKFREFHRQGEELRLRAIKDSFAVTDQQWEVIEPKLKKLEVLLHQSQLSVRISGLQPVSGQAGYSLPPRRSQRRETQRTPSGVGMRASSSGGGGGFGSTFPWRMQDRPPTEGEKTCEELYRLLANRRGSQEQIQEKMQALRGARAQAKKELVNAQNELRELLNLRQQAHLVLAGYLD